MRKNNPLLEGNRQEIVECVCMYVCVKEIQREGWKETERWRERELGINI